MEIEKKYLIPEIPSDLNIIKTRRIEQGYLCTDPVVRIRREEYNLPLTSSAYEHLRSKIDGRLIRKFRHVIPIDNNLFIELDVFQDDLSPLILAEVEFPSEEMAENFQPPSWFGEDVTFSSLYHNSTLSKTEK